MKPYYCIGIGLLFLVGCRREGVIEVDLTTQPTRFIVDQRGWPAPFKWPRVTEFAIASEEDGALWELRSVSSDGEPARLLAFVYGDPPAGFTQVTPDKGARPKPFVAGRTYYVAAGGPSSLFRIVFALPVDTRLPPIPPTASAPSGVLP